MAKHQEYQAVVFLDSAGNEISNDPIWHAQKRLAEAGLGDGPTPQVGVAVGIPAVPLGASDDDSIDSATPADLDSSGNRTYKELNGQELQALAKERNVDITGLKKVGEVRDALKKADADAAAQAEVDAANAATTTSK